jgi:hypothetical protein
VAMCKASEFVNPRVGVGVVSETALETEFIEKDALELEECRLDALRGREE